MITDPNQTIGVWLDLIAKFSIRYPEIMAFKRLGFWVVYLCGPFNQWNSENWASDKLSFSSAGEISL